MSDEQFPSGLWVGFYTYRNRSKKHRQDLGLTFAKGTITGEGSDDIGAFIVRGKYDGKSAECHWTKTYVGKHDVFYDGYREGKGIYGKWEVGQTNHGGFHIWPLASGGGDDDTETKSKEKPLTSAVAKPVAVSSQRSGATCVDDIPSLKRLAETLVKNDQILQAVDVIVRGSTSQFPYRVFYILVAQMMRCCSHEQAARVSYFLDEFGAHLPSFVNRWMRQQELKMYMRFHDVPGIKNCLLIMEAKDPETGASEQSGSA